MSAAVGAKVTDQNPNIADLSDTNRPTKLAEQFSELYDNEWTDLFEHLNGEEKDKDKDQTAILLILKLFMVIYFVLIILLIEIEHLIM